MLTATKRKYGKLMGMPQGLHKMGTHDPILQYSLKKGNFVAEPLGTLLEREERRAPTVLQENKVLVASMAARHSKDNIAAVQLEYDQIKNTL